MAQPPALPIAACVFQLEAKLVCHHTYKEGPSRMAPPHVNVLQVLSSFPLYRTALTDGSFGLVPTVGADEVGAEDARRDAVQHLRQRSVTHAFLHEDSDDREVRIVLVGADTTAITAGSAIKRATCRFFTAAACAI